MPPATLPNVFPAPEGFTEGSLLIKEPGTGNVSPVLMEATSFGSHFFHYMFKMAFQANRRGSCQ